MESPEQRRMGIKDSAELAWRDWLGTARFDRPAGHWPGSDLCMAMRVSSSGGSHAWQGLPAPMGPRLPDKGTGPPRSMGVRHGSSTATQMRDVCGG